MVSGMTELLERSLGAAIQVKVDIPSGMPAIHVDLNQLELAILNLAVNARDAMPFGGSLSISAAPETFREAVPVPDLSPGDYIRISVTDTGVGMDDTILEQAREPFFTTKGPGKGTGLGLSMVQGLAVQSGGALQLRSKPVDLWLPKSRDVRSKTPVATPALTASQRHLNILLVDDDVLVRMGTLDMLEDLGHVVTEAGSAAEALTILQGGNTKVDVVITDQAMPGMRALLRPRRERQHRRAAQPRNELTPPHPSSPKPLSRSLSWPRKNENRLGLRADDRGSNRECMERLPRTGAFDARCGCGWRPHLAISTERVDAYLARFSTTSARPSPADAAGTAYFSSSPASVKGRFCSVPVQLGNELRSIW
jgi:CheY-like chemotaxis protein